MPANIRQPKALLNCIHALRNEFSAAAQNKLPGCLQETAKINFISPAHWKQYYQDLQFLLAYPASANIYRLAKKEAGRVAGFLQRNPKTAQALSHSGLPGTLVTGCFSHRLNSILLKEDPSQITLHSFAGNKILAMQWLGNSLSELEKEMLSEEEFSWKDWIQRFGGNTAREQLAFFLSQTEISGHSITTREACFAVFEIFTTIRLPDQFSRFCSTTGKRITPFFHSAGLEKKGADHLFTFDDSCFKQIPVSAADQRRLVRYAQNAISPFFKETDPFTYAQPRETAYYDAGRGIGIALFYMLPEKKLALETYCGYLLLKNNVPLAYGGGWMLGAQCRFGLNILPGFRGGESVLIAQQLMRLYIKEFRVKQIIVEPFQIGKNNPEGIRSGAFWFYYKMGFRPLQPPLNSLAAKEFEKMGRRKSYRSNATVLKQLSASYLCLQAGEKAPVQHYDIIRISNRVSSLISEKFENSRVLAQKMMRKKYPVYSKKIPYSLLLLNENAAGGKKLSQTVLSSLALTFSLKQKNEKEYALHLQHESELLQLLLSAAE